MTGAYRFGPIIGRNDVTFRLWAPGAKDVTLLCDGRHAMDRSEDGWFTKTMPGVPPGTHYKFRIDDEIDVPDPASRFQPNDVHGPSELIDPAYDWHARGWKGRPWHECVFLELHVGTFTGDGTFRDAIDKLDRVAEAGFTAIELMPVADFYGRWNWGYDGVLLYAPDSAYGRPDDLKALIDAAHQRGLMVFLDVVYNHFGPEGNYLGRYAPQFFCKANTPWGNAIDYENPHVRRFAIENALYWLRDFRFDGLRLDAVHAITEPGWSILLNELSEATGRLASETGRHIHLVLENDANQASLLDPTADPPQGKYLLSSRLPCAADRRDRGLLRRLSRAGRSRRADGGQGICLSGRAVAAPQGRKTRRADIHPPRHRLRQFPAEPRSDRQPGAGRTAV